MTLVRCITHVIHLLMSRSELVVYEGECFTVEWGLASNGRCQAREYYDALAKGDRAKALALFVKMANAGKIYDTTKFNQEEGKLFVFKPHPNRFFCFFVKGRRIIIVTAYKKQGDKAPAREIERAESVRIYWMETFAEEESRGKK